MNSTTRILLKYEWKAFIRNRYQLLMLGAAFLFGLYAIFVGRTEINAQRQNIAAVQALEREEFAGYEASFTNEPASPEAERTHDIAARPEMAWFRHGYHAILPAHDYAALSVGQRDLFRYYYRLTGMSLHYQLFENELANPVHLMAGNFDLSFMLIYLLPLLIIAFSYGLYAADREGGTLPLLKIQSVSIRRIILIRWLFYFVVITSFALFISVIGLLVAGNPLTSTNQLPALVWLAGLVIYCAFWFALLFLLVSFRRSSSFNAMMAVACWLLLLIVIPGVLNVIVTTKYPLSSATLAGLTRRTGLENEDDAEEAKAFIQEFLAHEPSLAGTDSLLDNNMMAKAYAAFTALKDHENQATVDRYNEQVARRTAWTTRYHWLSPAVATQEAFSIIAQTDVRTFLRFQNELANFHGRISDFYFTRLFRDLPITRADYARLPSFSSPEGNEPEATVLWIYTRILIAAGLLFGLGFFKMRK